MSQNLSADQELVSDVVACQLFTTVHRYPADRNFRSYFVFLQSEQLCQLIFC